MPNLIYQVAIHYVMQALMILSPFIVLNSDSSDEAVMLAHVVSTGSRDKV